MQKYIPNMYKKSIFDVNYDKLKENNIKCLIFDLDNTILLIDKDIPDKNVCYFIKKLKKDFDLYIISNNSNKRRLDKVSSVLGIPYISFALKPLSFGFKRLMKRFGYKNYEMCIIGDQIMTDILGGNRLNIFTVLVEPLGKKDLKITSFNRFIEKRKFSKLARLGLFEKGDYYE